MIQVTLAVVMFFVTCIHAVRSLYEWPLPSLAVTMAGSIEDGGDRGWAVSKAPPGQTAGRLPLPGTKGRYVIRVIILYSL